MPSDGPQFRHRPQPVETHIGATEILHCDVDSNPPAKITWIHDESDEIVEKERSTYAVQVTDKTAGRYYCKAHVDGFPDLIGYATVYIQKAPSIVSQRIQYVPDEGVVKVYDLRKKK